MTSSVESRADDLSIDHSPASHTEATAGSAPGTPLAGGAVSAGTAHRSLASEVVTPPEGLPLHRWSPPVALVAVTVFALALVLAGCGLGGSHGRPVPTGEQVAGRLATDGLQDWGCGHAFTLGTTDQDTRLSLWFDGTTGAAGGAVPEPGTHDLGGAWTGELVAGRDLFAQWCDDVITPDEPEVVETASWEVDGTLTWQLEQGDGQCPSVAAGVLTDASVDVDGEAVPIADVALRNEHFGCVAG